MNIIWDLDGTLVDSMPVIARSMNRTRIAHGLPEKPLAELRPFIGPSIHQTFATFLATDDAGRIEQAVEYYRECYDKEMADSPVFAGIPEVLEDLHKGGCQQFVATAKFHKAAAKLLEAVGLARWFVEIYGSEAGGKRSDKPDLLAYLLRQESLRPAETLMIGDTRYDMTAARANDLTAIGVTWGYGENDDLIEGGAHSLVASPEELIQTIRQNMVCIC